MTDRLADKPAGRVTLGDVAREAGVSIKTVSRVVNREPEVNAATARRVAEVVRRLGYRPNELARTLKGGRSRTIGLMIADISNPFYAGVAKAVEEVARGRGYAVMLCASAEDAEVEKEYVGLFARRQAEGILLVPASQGNGHLEEERAAGLPIVALDRPAEGVAVDTVLAENRAGSREATRHLLWHGHRRVAFVGDDERVWTARERFAGYAEALREAGLEPAYRFGAKDAASAEAATRGLLDLPAQERPTAFFAGNNLIAAGVLKALDEAGLGVPGDVAFVGFDDFDLAATLRPRLTVVRQPAYELGRRAANLLLERLDGDHRDGEPERLVLPTELVVRESCGCRHPAYPA